MCDSKRASSDAALRFDMIRRAHRNTDEYIATRNIPYFPHYLPPKRRDANYNVKTLIVGMFR